jgi:hypothetical protein
MLSETLNSFTGTTGWYPQAPNVLLTDGTNYLGDMANAYWLMDMIASHLPNVTDPFAIALLTVNENGSAEFVLQDDIPANKIFAQQHLDFTDFPLKEIKLYVINDGVNWVILLPSEY